MITLRRVYKKYGYCGYFVNICSEFFWSVNTKQRLCSFPQRQDQDPRKEKSILGAKLTYRNTEPYCKSQHQKLEAIGRSTHPIKYLIKHKQVLLLHVVSFFLHKSQIIFLHTDPSRYLPDWKEVYSLPNGNFLRRRALLSRRWKLPLSLEEARSSLER